VSNSPNKHRPQESHLDSINALHHNVLENFEHLSEQVNNLGNVTEGLEARLDAIHSSNESTQGRIDQLIEKFDKDMCNLLMSS